MWCANSSSIEVEEEEKKKEIRKSKNNNKNYKFDNSDNKIEDKSNNENKNLEDSQDNSKKEDVDKKKDNENKKQTKKKLEIKTTGNKKPSLILSTDENKNISNIYTEGLSETKKIKLQQQNYEGVTLMKGVEEYIPEDLNEEDVYNLVENALYGYNIKEDNKDIGEISKKQAKAISSILYNKIHKKEINMKDYPELKGLTVKIGVEKLTKDVIRKMMFNNKNVDDCQIDLTYANLTKKDDDIKALTIELLK